MPDKLNHIDYHWFLVRTQPGHERELSDLIEQKRGEVRNVLEAYCPTHTTVNVRLGSNERKATLFDGYVFVLATQGALVEFLRDNCPNAFLRYNRKRTPDEKATPCIIPEDQMRAFKDFNENYAEMVVVLERPYTDYAFNPREGNQANEIVRVLDGPLAGCEGYVCRLNRKRGLVFQVQGMMPGSHLTVSYPNIYDLHVVRLHNAEADRLSIGTEKARAADCLIGLLQACGYGGRMLPMLYGIMEYLSVKPSLVSLCKDLHKRGESALGMRLEQIGGKEAELVINLARYEHDNPGYVKQHWNKATLRPFLTPTSGMEMIKDQKEATLRHKDFTEFIRKADITEEVYYPTKGKGGTATTTYFAHVGIMKNPTETDGYILFANWNDFLGEYFLTGGKANEKLVDGTLHAARNGTADAEKEKLIESFRNFAPTLYKVLTDPGAAVKAIQNFGIGSEMLNVFAVTTTEDGVDQAKDELANTCIRICKEINATTHLAIWRRYLRTVWLHA